MGVRFKQLEAWQDDPIVLVRMSVGGTNRGGSPTCGVQKTLLLDEVRLRHRIAAIAYLALDEVVSTPEDLAHAFAAETLQMRTVKNS